MEKQEVSKEKSTENKIEQKFNKTTVFLSKFVFGENFDILKKIGFIDTYVEDPEIMKILTLGNNQRLLFLLFKTKKLKTEEIKKIVKDLSKAEIQVVFSYELVNDYLMVVIDFPENFISDYDNIVYGKYSKLSEEFKNGFPTVTEVFNTLGQRLGKEYTIYHHIFNKTKWLKEFWMEKLDLAELDDNLELWDKPQQKDLIFDKNKII